MKFWVKIIIAFCVVVVSAFAVWAFFFREKDEVAAYNEISELLEYKESTGLTTKLEKLEKMNYVNNDSSIVFAGEEENIVAIKNYRKKLLNNERIDVYDGSGTYLFDYNSYAMVDTYCNEFISYMLPKLNNIEGSSSALRKLKKSKREYISQLKDTLNSYNLLVELQTKMETTTMAYDALQGKYRSFSIEFRDLLNSAADIMNNMLSFYKSANGGEVLTSPYMSLYDAFARTLKTMTTIAVEEPLLELDYANDLCYVTKKIDSVNNDENIFSSEFTELQYLNSYNTLFNKNPEILDKIFSKKYLVKSQMADNQSLSEIPDKLHYNVVVVLNVLGY